MADEQFNLAIETSTRDGSIALGQRDSLLQTVSLGEQQRHVVALLPAIETLAKAHRFAPDALGELYISIGPGSFTGLRVAVTLAKMLARAHGTKIIAVPTLDVVATNAPQDVKHLAVCLNAKGGRCFTGLYERAGEGWTTQQAAALMTPAQIAAAAPRPLAMLGDAAVGQLDWPDDVARLDAARAVPDAAAVWRIGRTLAGANAWTDAYELTPLYIRLPDAEEKWREAKGMT